jgi:NAD(P)-dependent dehydrogenase (short-subunit alcohol dehydrogenase family)
MTNRLEGKIAVVTGGSSGIGLATAKRFIEESAYVFITGRRQSELDKAKAAIGRNVTTVQGDVANLDDLDRLYGQVRTEQGALDIVVACAGFVEVVPPAAVTPEHFDKTFGINARGTFFSVQKALPLIRDGGSIVFVSSGTHLKGMPFYITYAAQSSSQHPGSWPYFDTAGEVFSGYAAPSAISRANGVIRVLAREVSRNHSPSRNTFSPTAAQMCPRCTRLRPMSRVRRRRMLRVSREIVPSMPARRAYSA